MLLGSHDVPRHFDVHVKVAYLGGFTAAIHRRISLSYAAGIGP